MAWVYLNGDVLPSEAAMVPASSAGLLVGRGVFETFRARPHGVLRLDRHYERLAAGAHLLGIEMTLKLDDLREAVAAVVARNGLDDARVRLTLSAGPDGGRPNVLIQARPATDYPPHLYERGIRLRTASTRRNQASPLSRVKSVNYAGNLIARDEARRAGADEALLLNSRGSIAEGSATNVFIVRDAILMTPRIEDGALPGITRRVVLDIAHSLGLRVREIRLRPGDLAVANEVLVTNAVAGVLPVAFIDGMPVGDGRPGPATGRIAAAYQECAAGAGVSRRM